MEKKGSFIILLVIIAVLTLSLALLAGYMFFISGQPSTKKDTVQTNQPKVPDDSEFAYKDLFESEQNYNLKMDEDGQIHVIQINVTLKYFKDVKGIKNIEEKLSAYDKMIKECIGTYFMNISVDEVRNADVKERIKKELTKKINDLLKSSEKQKSDIVYDVIFDKWFYQ